MQITDTQKKELLLQFLVEERDKLLLACNYQINREHQHLYDVMIDQIARINKELFESRLAQSISMINSKERLQECDQK